MIKAMRVGQTVVCFIEGKMFQKNLESDEEIIKLFEKISNTDENDLQEIHELRKSFEVPKTSKEMEIEEEYRRKEKEYEQNKSLIEWMEDIKNLGDEHFRVDGLKLYMKGIDITIPEFLAREFAERRVNNEDLKSLQNFWRLCALNPDPRCREDLYRFLINNNMVVTPSGYFMAYRNANIKNEGNSLELEQFVNTAYAKIKGQKHNVNKYNVYLIGNEGKSYYEYTRFDTKKNRTLKEEEVFVGVLGDLYEDFQKNEETKTTYTDAHSGSTTINIGIPVKIDRKDCDANPDQTCSRGLHLGSTNFMSKGYFGKVGLVCLCNPMHVVAVPYTGGQKLRTSEYLPIGIAEYDENGKIIPIESATFEYEYSEHTEEEIQKMLSESRFESLKDHDIIPKELTKPDLRSIFSDFKVSRKEMNDIIKKRVTKAI